LRQYRQPSIANSDASHRAVRVFDAAFEGSVDCVTDAANPQKSG
jgi:hypothetical protein